MSLLCITRFVILIGRRTEQKFRAQVNTISDILAISGGSENYIEEGKKSPWHVVVITVDATTERTSDVDISNKEPSAVGVIGAVTNLQLTRYDYDSKVLVVEKVGKWAAVLSTPEHPVKTHLISISIQDVKDPKALAYLNSIPTSFALKGEQVDKLIPTGRERLLNNPEFQQMLTDQENQQALIKWINNYQKAGLNR